MNYCEDGKHKGTIFNTPKQAFDELRPWFEGGTLASVNNAKLNKALWFAAELFLCSRGRP